VSRPVRSGETRRSRDTASGNASRNPVRPASLRTWGDRLVKRSALAWISAVRHVVISVLSPAQSMKDTPDRSASTQVPLIRRKRSRESSSHGPEFMSTSPATSTIKLRALERTRNDKYMTLLGRHVSYSTTIAAESVAGILTPASCGGDHGPSASRTSYPGDAAGAGGREVWFGKREPPGSRA